MRNNKLPIQTRIEGFRTVTPVWIHPWLWNDAQSLIWYRIGALLFFKVIHLISRSHRTKNHQVDPKSFKWQWVHTGFGNGLLLSGNKSFITWVNVDQAINDTMYRKVSNIRRTWVGNKIVDHSDIVGASPVGAAPTTSSFSTWHLAARDSAKTATRQYKNLLKVEIWCVLY